MNILKKINKNRCIVFGIETILPFMIPFIFEIPEEYIVRQVQLIIVILLSLVDMLFIFEINKQQKADEEKNFKNKIARDAYSNIYELNERKRNYIANQSYKNNFVISRDAMPYNIHEYIAEICDSFRNVLAQVTDINKEYVSVSFIYHYIYKNVSEDDKNWKWIVGREQTMQTPLNQFVEKENTVYHTLIKGSETVVFYNDKQSMAEVGRYYMSARDERHSRIGSIFGVQLMFSNNAELFVEGVMVVSTYGKKFVPSNDINKINQLKRLVIDDLLPSYQRMLETEMGMLYLRHLDSESCLQQRQHWGQRLHRKNKELWKKR